MGVMIEEGATLDDAMDAAYSVFQKRYFGIHEVGDRSEFRKLLKTDEGDSPQKVMRLLPKEGSTSSSKKVVEVEEQPNEVVPIFTPPEDKANNVLLAVKFNFVEEMREMRARISGLESRLDTSEAEVAVSQARIAATEARVAATEARVAATGARIAATEARIAASEATIATIQAAITGMNSRLMDAEAIITNLKSNAEVNNQRIEKLECRLKLQEDIGSQGRIVVLRFLLEYAQKRLAEAQAASAVMMLDGTKLRIMVQGREVILSPVQQYFLEGRVFGELSNFACHASSIWMIAAVLYVEKLRNDGFFRDWELDLLENLFQQLFEVTMADVLKVKNVNTGSIVNGEANSVKPISYFDMIATDGGEVKSCNGWRWSNGYKEACAKENRVPITVGPEPTKAPQNEACEELLTGLFGSE